MTRIHIKDLLHFKKVYKPVSTHLAMNIIERYSTFVRYQLTLIGRELACF